VDIFRILYIGVIISFLEFQRHLMMFLQMKKKGKMLPSDPPIAIFCHLLQPDKLLFNLFCVSHISVPKIFPFLFYFIT